MPAQHRNEHRPESMTAGLEDTLLPGHTYLSTRAGPGGSYILNGGTSYVSPYNPCMGVGLHGEALRRHGDSHVERLSRKEYLNGAE
jgi:hypothetical protein